MWLLGRVIVASSVSDATAFVNAAVTGGVGIDPDAAQVVLNKIRTGKDHVEDLMKHATGLGAVPRLGANPVGIAMARKFAARADGDGDSYAAALRNLYTQYEQVEAALEAAIRNYAELDAAEAATFNRKA